MWDGFGRKARGKVLSGLRGAGFRDGEGAEKQKRRFWKKEKEIGIALAIAAGILVTAGGGYAAVHAKRTGAIKNQEMVKDSEVETLTTLEASSGIIGEGAFSGNLNLKNIKVPEGVTSIGAGAFSSCVNLESIQLPESLEDIGYGLFPESDNFEVIMTQEQKNKWDNRDYWDSDFARGSRGSSAASFEEFLFGSWYNQNGDKNYRITIR